MFTNTNADATAAQMAASVFYGMVLEPIADSLGDVGSLVTKELADFPTTHPQDPLSLAFARLFAAERVGHE